MKVRNGSIVVQFKCATIDALNFNIQWHCRVINNKDHVNLYDSIRDLSLTRLYKLSFSTLTLTPVFRCMSYDRVYRSRSGYKRVLVVHNELKNVKIPMLQHLTSRPGLG